MVDKKFKLSVSINIYTPDHKAPRLHMANDITPHKFDLITSNLVIFGNSEFELCFFSFIVHSNVDFTKWPKT